MKNVVYGTLKDRLTGDYQLTLVVFISTVTIVVVSPFAVYRFLSGDLGVALVDTVLVSTAIVSGVYAVRTGRTKLPGLVMSVLLCASLIAVSNLLGLAGALWFFPVIFFLFYLVSPVRAFVLTLLILGYYAVQQLWTDYGIFSSTELMFDFVAAGIAMGTFSYFFSLRASRQRKELYRLATRDPLTGLYNRRSLDDELRVALAGRDRYGHSYGLIILDLDDFKIINDRAGHAAGDAVLEHLAELIKSSTRAEDRAFRYGGDEFVILCTGIDRTGLRTIAEHLIGRIRESLHWDHQSVTASLGAALLRADDDRESWNIRADKCLYTAKDRGRNIAVVDTDV